MIHRGVLLPVTDAQQSPTGRFCSDRNHKLAPKKSVPDCMTHAGENRRQLSDASRAKFKGEGARTPDSPPTEGLPPNRFNFSMLRDAYEQSQI